MKTKPKASIPKRILRTSILLAVLGVAASCFGVLDKLFYCPDRTEYSTPSRDGLAYEEVEFTSEDGTVLSGWFIPALGEAKGTVIHFHGNAQNMSAHFSFVSWLPKNGYNLFVFDYRGYGNSKGNVSREGVYEDAVAAVKTIKTRTDIDQNKLILFGQSIGGANVLAVAGSNEFEGVVGVVAESAFASYKGVAFDHAGILKPAALVLIGNKYSPKRAVHNIAPTPLILIHGTADQVVPYDHAEKLFEAAGEPKELWTIPNGRHTDALGRHRAEYIPRLLKLFNEWVTQ